MSTNPLNEDGTNILRVLAEAFITSTQARVRDLEAIVRTELDAMELDTVYRFPDLEYPVPMAAEVGENRHKKN